jgi:murein DD-endopeptidase MepM/ murein hydrolase activator NlpD
MIRRVALAALLCPGLVFSAATAPAANATGALTLPILGFGVSSWFDHTSPDSGGAGLSDNSTTMTRYDGTTAWSYNGHAGLDYGTSQQTGYSVVAATDGTVQFVGWENPNNTKQGFGFYVRLTCPPKTVPL